MNQPIVFKYVCPSISSCKPYEIELSTGTYRFEAWGAQGGGVKSPDRPRGGKGGYTSGEIKLKTITKFYIYVGSHGSSYPDPDEYAFNGGGKGYLSGGGGGATDFRLENYSVG